MNNKLSVKKTQVSACVVFLHFFIIETFGSFVTFLKMGPNSSLFHSPAERSNERLFQA